MLLVVLLLWLYMVHNCEDIVRNDHTTMTAPLPVCSAKLSMVWPG